MTTAKDIIKLFEGTWSVPFTLEKANKLKSLMAHPLNSKDAKTKVYDLLGNDSFFDQLDWAEKEYHGKDDARQDIANAVRRLLKDYHDRPSSFMDKPDQQTLSILKHISEFKG